MKPAPFEYARPASIEDAVALLAGAAGAKLLAGGQTLGPMLNLRLVQPALLVDITRIAELAAAESNAEWVAIGATVTHAAIEDRRAPLSEPLATFLARVAGGIAYRAVRTRGTIGGSLAHADPAADWLSCLIALDAEAAIAGRAGKRKAALADLVRGAMETGLAEDELLVSVRVPKLSRGARFGFHKICRKTGEFADAIGVAAFDPERGMARLVAGAGSGPPVVLDGAEVGLGEKGTGKGRPDTAALERALAKAGLGGDAYELRLHAVALRRAMEEAFGA
jgi:carbon-monoxide dehydrogenase medium subunit